MEGADGDADQAEDFDAEGVEDAADLAVFAFVKCEFEPGVFFAGAEEGCSFAAEEFVVFGFDSTLEGVNEVRVGHGGDLHVVGLVEMGFGIGDPGVPFGIVGEEEEAFGGFVEAADGGEPGRIWRQECVDSIPAFLVCSCSDDATRLVHHEIDFFRRLERLSLHFNAIGAEADRGFGILGRDAIEADFALAD